MNENELLLRRMARRDLAYVANISEVIVIYQNMHVNIVVFMKHLVLLCVMSAANGFVMDVEIHLVLILLTILFEPNIRKLLYTGIIFYLINFIIKFYLIQFKRFILVSW